MLFGGAEVIEDSALDDVAEVTVLLPAPEVAVEPGVAVLPEADAELVELGRLEEPDGNAEPLADADPEPDPDAAEEPSKLGKPVTTTEVG